jgi:tetratricopeptide (TPR) repeat protein
MKPFLVLVLALNASLAFAQRNPELEKAQLLLSQKKYADALKSLDAAAKKGGLDRESLLTLLESRGLAQASLGQLDRAEENFRSVLQLEPKRDLTGKYAGKVAGVIASAKEWFKANGGIEVGPLEPGVQDGRVKQVSLFVKNDPLKLITQVRFYLRKDGGAWKPAEVQVVNGAAATDVDGDVIEWWAELMSERKDQLMFLGSAGRPIKQSAPLAVPEPVVVAKKDAPVPEKKLEPRPVTVVPDEKNELTEAPAQANGSALRPVGYVLLGLGVVAAGVGTYFGVTSSAARDGIKKDLAAGGFDTAALYARDQTAIGNARIANILFASAGGLAIAGGICWFLGRDVVVVPGAGGGFAVIGQF